MKFNFENLFNKNLIQSFENATPTKKTSVFILADGQIYLCVHFENGIFKDPEDKSKEIDIKEYVKFIMNEFGAKKVILSCCYPSQAKDFLSGIDNLEILASEWDGEVKTLFNDKKNILKVEKIPS